MRQANCRFVAWAECGWKPSVGLFCGRLQDYVDKAKAYVAPDEALKGPSEGQLVSLVNLAPAHTFGAWVACDNPGFKRQHVSRFHFILIMEGRHDRSSRRAPAALAHLPNAYLGMRLCCIAMPVPYLYIICAVTWSLLI